MNRIGESNSSAQQHVDIGEDEARRPAMPDQLKEPIKWLIYRMMFLVDEQLQDGPVPLATRASTLAMLYQAQALCEIAEQLASIDDNLTGIRSIARDLDAKLTGMRINPNQPL